MGRSKPHSPAGRRGPGLNLPRGPPCPAGAATARDLPWHRRARWGPGALGLAGRGSPSSPSPRFRPTPGGGRDRGRAAPSARAWERPPPARAPARRAHRPREEAAPGPSSLRCAPETVSEPDAGCCRPAPRSLPPRVGRSTPAAAREPGRGGARAGGPPWGAGGEWSPRSLFLSQTRGSPEGPTPGAVGRDPRSVQPDP